MLWAAPINVRKQGGGECQAALIVTDQRPSIAGRTGFLEPLGLAPPVARLLLRAPMRAKAQAFGETRPAHEGR
jgi:hypothetical protein